MNKESIVAYLAQGFTAAKVATILGCSESYISEVSKESWFDAALVEAKKSIKRTQEEEILEDQYVRLESTLVKTIKEQMPFAEFRDLVRMTEVLIKRKQASIPVGGIVFNNTQNNTVLLQIPSVVAPEITVNAQREILAVGEQTMAPMTTQSVRKLFEGLKEKRQEPARLTELLAECRILETVPEDF